MKIAAKIGIIFFLSSVVFMSFGGFILYEISARSLKREISAHFQTTTQSRKDHIITYISLLKSSLSQLSKSVLAESLLTTAEGDPRYKGVFDQVQKRLSWTESADPSLKEISLINSTGKVVASTNPERIGHDDSANPIFTEGRIRVYVRDAYFSEIYKMPMISISAPVTSKDTGSFLGVMAARISMDSLCAILENRTGLGDTGEIFIVNKYGYMITPSKFFKDTFLKKKISTENYKMSLAEHRNGWPVVTYIDYKGAEALGMHDHIADMRWTVLSKIDAKEAFMPLFKLRLAIIAMVALSAVLAWFLGIAVASVIMRPLQRMREGMAIVGSGNIDYKLSGSSKDEIGTLSSAFNSMTGNLRKSIITIDSLNREIAERKKAEEERNISEAALSISEQKARAIFDQTLQLIGLTTPEGILVEANKAALDMGGVDESAVLGKPFWDTVWWSHSSDMQERLKKAISEAGGGRTVRFEATHTDKDGKTHYIDFSIKPVKDESGKVVFLVPEGRDITEQKAATDMVLKAAREWATTFDSMSEGISIHDPDHTVVNANASLCRMLGKSREEIVGRKCYEIFHGKSGPPADCPLEKAARSGRDESVEFFEPFLGRWLSASVSPVRDDKGNVVKLIHAISDITDRKTFQEELARSEKLAALGRFAAGAAHEIKNPLGIILGGFELLQAGAENAGPEMKSTIATLSTAVMRVDAIINALSKLSEVAEISIKRVDVKQLVEDTVFLMKSRLARPGVKIGVECEDGIYIEADGERLQEAITVVLQNAADSIKDTGKISVRTARDGAGCVIEVSDTGEGIPANDISNVFEPFFTTRRDRKRIGLGLTVAKEIVNIHKGEISVDSIRGEGTVVRIVLPSIPFTPIKK